ncbi:periplasmic nitrate reductase, NapE protein [Thalassotalea euphylliae]|uniref:periplasmic nitrate reductase, NapE protein n=1 Tax=Thalassotalea euphylliae TaxID=1655234 RepID=UPI0036351884
MSEHDNEGAVVKRRETKALIVILVFFFPIVTTALVGSYGFIVWFSQLIFGPPGHG